MKTKFAVASLLAIALLGCNTISQTVTGPVDDHSQGGGPGASPSPGAGAGALPPGSTVRVGLFGQSCPAGTTAPNNGLRQIIQGCTGFLTATPKGADGNDLSPAIHGPSCQWSSSGAISLFEAGNPFNRDGRCPTLGDSSVQATVKDVTGGVGISCVARASTSTCATCLQGQTVGKRVYFWTELATEKLKAEAIARDQAQARLE